MINDKYIEKKLDEIFNSYPQSKDLQDLYQEMKEDIHESAQALLDQGKQPNPNAAVDQAIKNMGDLAASIKEVDKSKATLSEYKYDVVGINNINVNVDFDKVKIVPSPDYFIHISQKQRPKSASYKLQVTKSGADLNVSVPLPSFSLKLIFSHPHSTVELALPNSYLGALNLELKSGSLNISNVRINGDLKLSLKSGQAKIEDSELNNVTSIVNSGSLKLVNVKSANFQSDIRSGTLKLYDVNAKFDVASHSGTIRGTQLTGSGKIASHSGTIRLAWQKLTGNVDLSVNSGTIYSVQPNDQDFAFKVQTRSGVVKVNHLNTNFEMQAQGAAIGQIGNQDKTKLPLVSAEAGSGVIKLE